MNRYRFESYSLHHIMEYIMKVRINEKRYSYEQLKKLVHEECETEILETCEKVAKFSTKAAIAEVLLVLHERKWHKENIQKLFEDMVCLYQRPAPFGKEVSDQDIINFIEKKYEIDFNRINPVFKYWKEK